VGRLDSVQGRDVQSATISSADDVSNEGPVVLDDSHKEEEEDSAALINTDEESIDVDVLIIEDSRTPSSLEFDDWTFNFLFLYVLAARLPSPSPSPPPLSPPPIVFVFDVFVADDET
jgi:hypothetical protein